MRERERERGIRERLVGRVEEELRETRSRVGVKGELEEDFWTAREVRQGCPLSLLLFSVLTANLEEMGRANWKGVRLGKRRVYTLAYADDIILIAEKEDEMRSMVDRMKRYLEKKRLELNAKKLKIMRFRKG